MQSQQKGDSDVHPQPVAVPVALQPGTPQGYPPVQPGAPQGYPPVQPGAPQSYPSVQPGAPRSYPPVQPGAPQSYPSVQPGAPRSYPPVQPGAPGYPPVQPGAPQSYPPVQPGAPQGYPPVQPGAPGYPAGAQNVPQQQQVAWMAPPAEAPPGCPPGLEYLTQIDQLLVRQQIELLEIITAIETENKYRICNSLGQQVYFATERSSFFQRQNCGAGRAFSMAITDNTQREVIHLERPFRCAFPGLQFCQPHTIEVQAPPGTVVGFVNQNPFSLVPKFRIQNAEGETVLNIVGPCCNCYTDVNFEVLSADGQQNVGRISKQWSGLAKEYFTDADNFGIQFPMDLDVKMKAVMLGACFLIDFMFFERTPQGQTATARRAHRHHAGHHY